MYRAKISKDYGNKIKLKKLLEKLKRREIPKDTIAKTIALFGREMFKEAKQKI